jgi:hypothetical protein
MYVGLCACKREREREREREQKPNIRGKTYRLGHGMRMSKEHGDEDASQLEELASLLRTQQ